MDKVTAGYEKTNVLTFDDGHGCMNRYAIPIGAYDLWHLVDPFTKTYQEITTKKLMALVEGEPRRAGKE